ncbi:hypothetical protein BpHYR1_031635 [Brachionus plicatilis]|uniref:Uncharacterized protein n=1 Tax=Brachionus plicatilis TaxID=10195 RepID=A0A3M7S4X2_BRAPC|nr:hypothetical protein BpHYR1_031635 [Brachionus plicatilis]
MFLKSALSFSSLALLNASSWYDLSSNSNSTSSGLLSFFAFLILILLFTLLLAIPSMFNTLPTSPSSCLLFSSSVPSSSSFRPLMIMLFPLLSFDFISRATLAIIITSSHVFLASTTFVSSVSTLFLSDFTDVQRFFIHDLLLKAKENCTSVINNPILVPY